MGLFSPIEDFLVALLLMLLVCRILGLLAKRLGVSSMVGEIVGGLILSPLLLNILSAGPDISLFADFAIIVIMFHSGLFTDFSSFRSQRVSSIVVGALGVAVTFLLIFCLTHLVLGFALKTSLFLGAIISNSAIEVCASVLRDVNNERLRSLVIGASFVDDIMAVFVLGVVLTFVGASPSEATPLIGVAGFSLPPLAVLGVTSVKVIVFLLLVSFVMSKVLALVMDRFVGRGFEVMLTIGFLTAFLLGILSRWVGLHEVIGVYLAGLILSRWGILPDPMLFRGISIAKFRETLSAMIYSLFSPIFFGFVGILLGGALHSSGASDLPMLFVLVLLMTFFALAGKVVGCGLGARLKGIAPSGALLIGVAMGGRGALEFILIQFGLEKGLMDQGQFSAVIIVTLMTIILTPVLFRIVQGRISDVHI